MKSKTSWPTTLFAIWGPELQSPDRARWHFYEDLADLRRNWGDDKIINVVHVAGIWTPCRMHTELTPIHEED